MFELCLVSEDFPDHLVQPKVHLSALHICLCSALGTEVCTITPVVGPELVFKSGPTQAAL